MWRGRALHTMVSKKSGTPKEGKCAAKGGESSSNREAGGKEEVAAGEKEAEKQGWLVERNERGWITKREVVSVVTCGYCGEKSTAVGTNYVRLDSIHDMWCERCCHELPSRNFD